ncbi:MAG: glycosyltransferase family 4 protein [Oscillospiraceae bacterium]|nr:glycosyltransferase family 4 protein [Oscillospiraceae bacterium]
MKKKKILFIMGRYLPGYRTGGPVRSTKNLIDALGDEYDFRVLCQDRDLGDKEQYPGIKLNDWNKVGKALVYYVPEKTFYKNTIVKLSKEVDAIYLWGCFDYYTIRTLWLRKTNQIRVPVIVAAMGLFSPKAFRIKYWKKKTVTTAMNVLGMFKNVYWSATSELEVSEIRQQIKTDISNFYVAEDLPRFVEDINNETEKVVGQLSVAWISRIAPKKNLLYAIEVLKKTRANIFFTIYGSIFDEEYWKKCCDELEKLPSNIKWDYKGVVESEDVVGTLRHHNVFLFPTLGENYGHVIQEALSAGLPCIISDQTPWKDLEICGAGNVFDLEKIDCFVDCIEKYASMDYRSWRKCSDIALKYAITKSNGRINNNGYRKMFDNI